MKKLSHIFLFIVLVLVTELILVIFNYKNLLLLKQYHDYKSNFQYKTITIFTQYDNKNISYILNTLNAIKFNNKPRIQIVKDVNNAMLIIQPMLQKSNQSLMQQTFVPVGHFYWIKDDFSPNIKNVYCISTSCKYLKRLLPKYNFIETNNAKDLLNKLKMSESTPALVDIKNLTPQFKLLTYNNHYFLDSKIPIQGAIIIYWNIIPQTSKYKKYAIAIKNIASKNISLQKYITNFDSKNISSVIQTGVTAISRGLAYKIESMHDYTYPARKIRNILLNADITHTSNEVSFVPGCKPNNGMRFCSSPNYFKLLKYINLDVVELTGNHNNDYGANWNAWTIRNFYIKNHIDYFGGGLNNKDASKILIKNIKGTKIAFLGYNYYDTIYNNYNALATSKHAGANSFNFKKLKNDIQDAKKQADIVIADFQFQECYAYPKSDIIYPICYKPLNRPDQKFVFRKAIDYGADIVVGTQAHQPQTYEIYKGKPIFYGLGNLFFDQIQWIGTRQALIIKHYFYKGKHIQTKIIPIIQQKDLQETIANKKQKTLLLKLLKQAR